MTLMGMLAPEAVDVMPDTFVPPRHDLIDVEELPHPPYRLPLLGDIVGLNPRIPFQSSLPQARQLGAISTRRMFGTDIVTVCGLDLVTEVHDDTRFSKYVGHHMTALRRITGNALFTAESDHPDWRLAHDILKPAFSRAAMEGYHTIMLDVLDELMDRWDVATGAGKPVDVTADMTRLTLETIGRAGFGYRLGSFKRRRPHPFVAAMNRALLTANWSTVPPLEPLVRPILRRAGEKMGRIVDDVIKARRAGVAPETHDLLDLMLNSAHPTTGRQLDPVNIRQQVITFMVAGHETTSGALSFALYYLTQNPDVLARARAEVDAVWGPADDPKPAYGDVAKLRYVRAVIDEALRLWPTAPGYLRVAREDTVIGGRYRIKKGQWLLVLLPILQRDPAVWSDPEEFKPERFMPGQTKNRAHAYKPFGTGQRACIARQFALHESALTLALILHRYDLTPQDDYELRISESITLKPEGFRLGLRRRAASSRLAAVDNELVSRSA